MTSPDRRPEVEGMPPQERVAGFLRQHRITVLPVESGQLSSFSFMQFPQVGGTAREIAEIQYDRASRTLVPASIEELEKRLEFPDLVSDVIRPFSRLLAQEQGDFYGERFEAIHAALDSIEARYDC